MNLDALVELRTLFSKQTGQKLHQSPVVFKKGIGAAAYHEIQDVIRVDPPSASDTEAVIFCDICHQSAHAYQRHKYGLIPYILIKTFARSFIEKQPQRIGLKAVDWYLDRQRLLFLQRHG